jgi:hypothetical protein
MDLHVFALNFITGLEQIGLRRQIAHRCDKYSHFETDRWQCIVLCAPLLI